MYLIGSSALLVKGRLRSRAVISSALARRGRQLGPVGVGPLPVGRGMECRWDFGSGPFHVYWVRRGRAPRTTRWV
jgi:hypothetical protein